MGTINSLCRSGPRRYKAININALTETSHYANSKDSQNSFVVIRVSDWTKQGVT